jgi:hypothetical protein
VPDLAAGVAFELHDDSRTGPGRNSDRIFPAGFICIGWRGIPGKDNFAVGGR